MKPIERFEARAVLLPVDNIDTDQIIPARFLKVTDKSGLGEALFADWRYDASGGPRPEFPLNDPAARGAAVLVAGQNFGCGSSREHAPWALLAAGFRAVVSTRFADIFRNNAIGNGLLPVMVDDTTHRRLCELLSADPGVQVTIDLSSQTLTLPDGSQAKFPMEPFDRHCLLRGLDRLAFLLAASEEITHHERLHTAGPRTLTEVLA
jgi:3-isopropylmalate/(R)-2-methylmalate dehydratase small subunit